VSLNCWLSPCSRTHTAPPTHAQKCASPFFGYAHPPPFGLAHLDSLVISRNFDFCAFWQFVKTSGTFGFAHFDNLVKNSSEFDFAYFDSFVKYLKLIFSNFRCTVLAVAQQGVWRQAGRCLVGHLVGIWKFTSRPSLCETPPDAKPQARCVKCVRRSFQENYCR